MERSETVKEFEATREQMDKIRTSTDRGQRMDEYLALCDKWRELGLRIYRPCELYHTDNNDWIPARHDLRDRVNARFKKQPDVIELIRNPSTKGIGYVNEVAKEMMRDQDWRNVAIARRLFLYRD